MKQQSLCSESKKKREKARSTQEEGENNNLLQLAYGTKQGQTQTDSKQAKQQQKAAKYQDNKLCTVYKNENQTRKEEFKCKADLKIHDINTNWCQIS